MKRFAFFFFSFASSAKKQTFVRVCVGSVFFARLTVNDRRETTHSQLRSLASEVVHPSFPGGRSGALRDARDADLSKTNLEWDVRFVAGLGSDPDACACNPEYFAMEGLEDEQAKRDLPEDESLAAELAAAAAKAAAKAREGEVRDALYLSVVHKFNACGVPLVVDPSDYGATPLPSKHTQILHTRLYDTKHVVGALERAVAAAPGAGDASARRRRRRFAEKTRRLQREMLPEGAETLLDDHLESIVKDAAAAASAIERLREEGTTEGAAAAESLADATSLARVYQRSARYGYFLRAVSARVRLERCAMEALHVDRLHGRTPTLLRSHGVANALRPPRWLAEAREPDAASMWLRASRGDAGMSSKADMASLASNIVGPLPAYPDSVGDWVEPVEEQEHTAWLKVEAPEESWRSRRESRRRRDEAKRAAALGAAYDTASIGDWIADDGVDDDVPLDGSDTPAPSAGDAGDANQTAATTEAKDDKNGEEDASAASFSRAAGEGFGGFSPSPAPSPSLSAVVSSMDLGLRASLAQIAGKETKAVLRDHVDALFGTSNRSRSATEKSRGARFDRGIAAYPGEDVCGNASVAPLDALRYLVVEAAAFGAGLHAAEKLGERYDLLHASRDAFEA